MIMEHLIFGIVTVRFILFISATLVATCIFAEVVISLLLHWLEKRLFSPPENNKSGGV